MAETPTETLTAVYRKRICKLLNVDWHHVVEPKTTSSCSNARERHVCGLIHLVHEGVGETDVNTLFQANHDPTTILPENVCVSDKSKPTTRSDTPGASIEDVEGRWSGGDEGI